MQLSPDSNHSNNLTSPLLEEDEPLLPFHDFNDSEYLIALEILNDGP